MPFFLAPPLPSPPIRKPVPSPYSKYTRSTTLSPKATWVPSLQPPQSCKSSTRTPSRHLALSMVRLRVPLVTTLLSDHATGKASGLMKRSVHGGKQLVPRTLMSHPFNGKMTYLCTNASTVGYVYPREVATCNFIHVIKLQDLKRPANCATLNNFITTHVELSLTNPGT